MQGQTLWRASLLALLLLTGIARAQCPPGNLLRDKPPSAARGVKDPKRLTDGLLALEGTAVGGADSSVLRGLRPFAQWDLGSEVPIVAAALQADNNDTYRLTVSQDGKHFETLWSAPRADEAGLRERVVKGLNGRARFVRLEAVSGDQIYSVSEVRLYCQTPDPWPPLRVVRSVSKVDPDHLRFAQLQNLKVVIGIVGMVLLFWVLPRVRGREQIRRRIVYSMIGLGALSWIQFGYFHGRSVVHYWDSFHYFMGSKYFPETGYFDLYRCVAKAERELGHQAEVDATPIRDVDDNRVYPGDWTRTPEGRCRVRFSRERWDAFKRDVEGHRRLFVDRTVAQALTDHGFNATPVNVAWLRLWTGRLTASEGSLAWLSVLDWALLLGTLWALYWGFGPVVCASAALFIGVGVPWNYNWIGGGILRHTWIACAAVGLALWRRGRPLGGGFLLTTAGLLRLFPLVFLGAAMGALVVRYARERTWDRAAKRAVAGSALAVATLLPVGGMVNGVDSYRGFAHVVERHSSTPLANHLGLSTLLGYRHGQLSDDLDDPRLTDSSEVWREQVRVNRRESRPLWLFAVVVAFGLVVWAGVRKLPLWQCAALGGPLLFALQSLTSYDYMWLVLLIPLGQDRWRRAAWVVGFALFTQVLWLFVPSIEVRHVVYALVALALMMALSWDVVRVKEQEVQA